MYQINEDTKDRTRRLLDPAYCKRYDIESLVARISGYLKNTDRISGILLHYVEDKQYQNHLAAKVLLTCGHQNDKYPASCIQGELTEGFNEALVICQQVGVVLTTVVPDTFTTDLSGLLVSRSSHQGT